MVTLDDEAVIYTGLELHHAEGDSSDSTDSTDDTDTEDGPTVQEVYESMTPVQKDVVHYMVGAALELPEDAVDEATSNEVKQSAIEEDEEGG